MTVRRLGISEGSWDDKFIRVAREAGFPIEEFQTVKSLPTGISVIALGGVHGKNGMLQCLFFTEDCDELLRNVYYGKTEPHYMIHELGLSALELQSGEEFLIEDDSPEANALPK